MGSLFLANGKETFYAESHEHDCKSEVVHHLTAKYPHKGMTQSGFLHHSQASATSRHSFFKKGRNNNCVFHQSASHIDLK